MGLRRRRRWSSSGVPALSAVALQQPALTETHGERWLLLSLVHAYAMAVATSSVLTMFERTGEPCVWQGLTCFAASKLASVIAETLGNLERVLAPLGHGSGARHVY